MSAASRFLCAIALAAVLFVPATSRADGDDRVGDTVIGSIAHDGAEVRATLRLRDGSTTYRFEYTGANGQRDATPEVTVDRDEVGRTITASASLSGLAPATRYSVRLVAINDDHDDEGAWKQFTTAAAPISPPPAPAQPPGDAPPAAGAPQPQAAPDLGVSVVAGVERGAVRVRLPGSDEFVDLAADASVPVGTVVDARHGTLALTTALPGGGVQQGSFGGARFQVRQSAGDGFADLHLRGSLAACRPRKLAAVAAGKPPRKPVRRLWGKDHGGRFRTHGRDSVTTVRGTKWSVADRCDGTLTRVTEGAVDVRVRRSGRVVRIAAGERFLARHRR
jgi:hypothetical protein